MRAQSVPFASILSDKNLNLDDKMHLIDMLGNNRRDDERMRPAPARVQRGKHFIQKREDFEDYYGDEYGDISVDSEKSGKNAVVH